MKRQEMIDSMSELSRLEASFKQMAPEYQKENIQRYFADAMQVSNDYSESQEISSIMLHYGIKGKNACGPSPILASKPAKANIADGVIADEHGVGSWLVIQRHPRHFYFVEHSHSFVEIIFMLRGGCTNIVNGKTLRMHSGDFLIMAPGCRHHIEPLNDEDLLINIILLPISAEMILEKTVSGKSELAQFLIAVLYSSSAKSNYAFINANGEDDIYDTACDLLREYFDQDQIGSEALVECRMHELFILLWRYSEQHPERISFAFSPNSKASLIISYIKENCVTCTRESVAKHFSYSPSRIGNILNKSIGKGFLTLRNEFRLNLAESKLMSTDHPVRIVADECGFTNITQFYKVYKNHFGKFPREDRLSDRK